MNFAYLLLGILVGIFSGFVGIGGGILIIPALVYLLSHGPAPGTGHFPGSVISPHWSPGILGVLQGRERRSCRRGLDRRRLSGGRLFWRNVGAATSPQSSSAGALEPCWCIVGLRFFGARSNGIPVRILSMSLDFRASDVCDAEQAGNAGKNREKTLTADSRKPKIDTSPPIRFRIEWACGQGNCHRFLVSGPF